MLLLSTFNNKVMKSLAWQGLNVLVFKALLSIRIKNKKGWKKFSAPFLF
jgi:hypothetical protein